jgi:threonine dehydratase
VRPTREDVERARGVLAGRIHRTPTFSSAALGVSLKAELFQKTGSFKARGALNRLAALTPQERERRPATTRRRSPGRLRRRAWTVSSRCGRA